MLWENILIMLWVGTDPILAYGMTGTEPKVPAQSSFFLVSR